jgi:hypothetical protein
MERSVNVIVAQTEVIRQLLKCIRMVSSGGI